MMQQYLEKMPEELKSLIATVRYTASALDVPVYLVGGFVRDLLLGVKNLDLDIVVEGDAIRFAGCFASALHARLISHKRFGTATVVTANHVKIDVATARKECYPVSACLPVVTPSTLREDLARRDFTINAMAVGIGRAGFGQLIDYCNGADDLRRRTVRTLHPLSFIDDPTRVLRAVRFEQRYGFKIEKETLKNLRDAVSLCMLEKVQPQRIRDELVLLLKEAKPVRALRRLQSLAGLGFIDRQLGGCRRALRMCGAIERQAQWYGLTHTRHRALDAWVMYLMGLVDGLSVAHARALCARYMFLKGVQKRILDYKAVRPALCAVLSKKGTRPSKVHALLQPLSYEAILVLRAKYRNDPLRRHISDFLSYYSGARIHIGGGDLMRLGLPPGPRYQMILQAVHDARIDGKVRTRQEELDFARQLLQAR